MKNLNLKQKSLLFLSLITSSIFYSQNLPIVGFGDYLNYRIDTYAVQGSSGLDLHWHGGIRFGVGASNSVMQIIDGKVGIGTDSPSTKLDVRGVISTPEIAFRNADGGDDSDSYRLRKVQATSNNNWLELQLNDDGDESFRIYGNSCAGAGCGEYSNNLYHSFDTQGNVFHSDNVGIGIMNPTDKLAVNGTIHSKEVKVDMTGWSDFVFKKEYKLLTLEEVEKHIKEKGHL